LLSQVLEPNREVDPRYLAYSVELRDGRLLLGVLAGENANAVILRTATGESVTLNREEIEAIRSTSKSLMPENLENELSPQQAADLFAWVQSLRQ
jgi:putative heme-binding domain-containing protein